MTLERQRRRLLLYFHNYSKKFPRFVKLLAILALVALIVLLLHMARKPDTKSDIEQFYRSFGYEVTAYGVIPTVQRRVPFTCDRVFGKPSSLEARISRQPPKAEHFPRLNEFTLNGRAEILDCYVNDTHFFDDKVVVWSQELIEEKLRAARVEPANNLFPYCDSIALHSAMKHYPVSGARGLVIGSKFPWAEVFCLLNGAERVVTVDYHPIRIEHSQMEFMSAVALVEKHQTLREHFDFAVSFSSIEHAGLGRYGDPVDPWADVKEVQKTKCLLKKGGILFLGLPVGIDKLGINCHRIYGKWRLPLVMEGFDLLDVFDTSVDPLPLSERDLGQRFDGQYSHHILFVLRNAR